MQEDGDAMPRQRKRPTVMPERASYGTARGDAGTPTSENPTGTPPEGEPRVWTERMLAALDKGVKGGKWYSLIDKLYPEAFLRAAFTQVAANHGARGGSCHDHEVRERSGRQSGAAERSAAHRELPAAAHSTALHPQAGEPGAASTGDTNGARPGGADGPANGAGADLRAGFRPPQRSLPQRRLGAFAPDGAASTRRGGSMRCSRPASSTSSMPT